jgi:hypothetical protein
MAVVGCMIALCNSCNTYWKIRARNWIGEGILPRYTLLLSGSAGRRVHLSVRRTGDTRLSVDTMVFLYGIDKKLDTYTEVLKQQGVSTWLHVLVVVPRLRHILPQLLPAMPSYHHPSSPPHQHRVRAAGAQSPDPH